MGKNKMVDHVVQVAYHRNGVGGEGFHAVIFDTSDLVCKCGSFDGAGWVNGTGELAPCHDCGGAASEFTTTTRRMVASVFDGAGQVAVFDIAKLSDPAIGIAFGANSWRGDRYEAELRAAIENTASDGSIKMGPFAIPTKRSAR